MKDAERESARAVWADAAKAVGLAFVKFTENLTVAWDAVTKAIREAFFPVGPAVALVSNGQTVGWIERDGDVAWISADAIRAALATGEGQHVAREVFTADGIPFVRCSCTSAKSPTSSRWLAEHVPNGGVAELQAVIKRQDEGAKA